MDMPKPGPGHENLKRLTGEWSGEETMMPSPWCPDGANATATLSNRIACDGFYVVGDYEQKIGGHVTFRGHSVFGFDSHSGDTHLHWFDSMGMGADLFKGRFDGSKLVMSTQSPMGHHRMTYDFVSADTLHSKMEFSQDGAKWSTMFEGTYRKSG